MFQQHYMKIESNLSEDANTTVESDNYTLYTLIPNSIRFALLLIFEIPSIICYIFVIGFILSKKTLRLAPNNYVMLIILFISFIIVLLCIPEELNYYRRHSILIPSSTFCLIWWFIYLFSFSTCQLLVAWASFERHILIFHGRLLRQKWKKICFYYMPPLVLIIYVMSFYIYVFFLLPCESYFYIENQRCNYPCFLSNPVLNMWQAILHSMFPTICIIVFSFSLIIRVYRSRTHHQQLVNWRKYRKMLFQLISISSLYLSINFPYFIISILDITGLFGWTEIALECLGFFVYFNPLLLPFICLTSLPKIWTKIKRKLHCRAHRQIQPIPLRALAKNGRIQNIQI